MERADIGWGAGVWVDPNLPRTVHSSAARARHARFGDWPRTAAHSGGNLGGSMAKHGRYRIVRPVADGGMAEIFLATQMGRDGFQKPVILKRIHSSIYADPQFRNMFIDEA